MSSTSFPLVSVKWLSENSRLEDLVILDASMHPDNSKLSATSVPSIPNAIFFDLKKDFSDRSKPFPNTLPTGKQFAESCNKMGVRNKSIIVIYDQKGIYTSPRAWWLFKTMGHENVYVLNGGWPAWEAEELPLGKLKHTAKTGSNYETSYHSKNVRYYNDILSLSKANDVCILDARSEQRFKGITTEPRPELQSGAIPNSINLPYTSVLENGFYKSQNELAAIFKSLNIGERPLIFSCGSGITACIILLAAELVLENPKSIYDGSWTEWATLQKLFTP